MSKVLQNQRFFRKLGNSLKPISSKPCPLPCLTHLSAYSTQSFSSNCAVVNLREYHLNLQYRDHRIFFNQTPRRYFASRAARKKDKELGALVNENLIRSLLEKSKKDAKASEVRLVIDKGKDSKPDIEVMSVADAIALSIDMEVDLIEINLEQDPPVIRAMDEGKFLYQQSKKKSGGGNNKKQTKQYSFKAGIDDNDLERKANNLISYLNKGHSCQVTISSNVRNLMADNDAIISTLDRVRDLIGANGKEQGKLLVNERGNRGSVLFQPTSKKK